MQQNVLAVWHTFANEARYLFPKGSKRFADKTRLANARLAGHLQHYGASRGGPSEGLMNLLQLQTAADKSRMDGPRQTLGSLAEYPARHIRSGDILQTQGLCRRGFEDPLNGGSRRLANEHFSLFRSRLQT